MLLHRSIGIGADVSLVLADLLADRQMRKAQLQGTSTYLFRFNEAIVWRWTGHRRMSPCPSSNFPSFLGQWKNG